MSFSQPPRLHSTANLYHQLNALSNRSIISLSPSSSSSTSSSDTNHNIPYNIFGTSSFPSSLPISSALQSLSIPRSYRKTATPLSPIFALYCNPRIIDFTREIFPESERHNPFSFFEIVPFYIYSSLVRAPKVAEEFVLRRVLTSSRAAYFTGQGSVVSLARNSAFTVCS